MASSVKITFKVLGFTFISLLLASCVHMQVPKAMSLTVDTAQTEKPELPLTDDSLVSYRMPLTPDTTLHTELIPAANDKLYDKLKTWFVIVGKTDAIVLKVDDKPAGKLSGTGVEQINTGKEQLHVSFEIAVTIKEGAFGFTADNFYLTDEKETISALYRNYLKGKYLNVPKTRYEKLFVTLDKRIANLLQGCIIFTAAGFIPDEYKN